ncbi:MAG: hypothetical protein WCP98_04310 [Actinomycetes bacterium]
MTDDLISRENLKAALRLHPWTVLDQVMRVVDTVTAEPVGWYGPGIDLRCCGNCLEFPDDACNCRQSGGRGMGCGGEAWQYPREVSP